MNLHEWRWVRPDPNCGLFEHEGGRWEPALIVELARHPERNDVEATAFVEGELGQRGTVAVERIGKACIPDEFLPTAWEAMQRRAAQVAGDRGAPCSS